MSTFKDIEKNASEHGFLMDGCGLDDGDKYYWNGSFTDFCGFNPVTERCYCGYDKDNPAPTPEPSGDTSATTVVTFFGTLPYSEYGDSSKITSDAIECLSQRSDTMGSVSSVGITEKIILEPIGIPNLNTISEAEKESVVKANAKTISFAFESKLGTPIIENELGQSETYTSSSVTIDGISYTVCSFFDYESQTNLYDSLTQTPTEHTLKYKITFN
jgi:hypothetical protein